MQRAIVNTAALSAAVAFAATPAAQAAQEAMQLAEVSQMPSTNVFPSHLFNLGAHASIF